MGILRVALAAINKWNFYFPSLYLPTMTEQQLQYLYDLGQKALEDITSPKPCSYAQFFLDLFADKFHQSRMPHRADNI